MTLESFLTFFIFSFHTPKGFPSLHCICRIHHVSLLLVPSPPIQTSIMSCMDNCSSLLNYPLLPSLASYILFSSNLLKCCFSNWNIEDISLLFTTPPHLPVAHLIKQTPWQTTSPPYFSDLMSCQPLPSSLFPRHNSLTTFCQHWSLPKPQSPYTYYFFYLECPSSWYLHGSFFQTFAQISLYQGVFPDFKCATLPHYPSIPHAMFNIPP